MHDETQKCQHVRLHTRAEIHTGKNLNAVLMGGTSQEQRINTSATTRTTTGKTRGLISHTQLVHLVNVKRAVIVNYIPI